jgi:hypothetical protein
MKPTRMLLGVAVILVTGLTNSYGQDVDLIGALRTAVIEQEQGRRVDLLNGDLAPWPGTLLDDAALEVVRQEVVLLRREVVSLRSALEAQKELTEIWEAEARGSGLQRIGRAVMKYGCTAIAGLAIGIGVTK